MILIGREDPSPRLGHVNLHYNESGGMARRMTEIDSWCQFEEVSGESLPIEIEGEVMWKIDSEIRLGRNRLWSQCERICRTKPRVRLNWISAYVKGVFQFQLMDVNRNFRAEEML